MEAIEKYGNVNQGFYTEYYDFIRNGNVRDEEIVTDNTTYAMLTMVSQRVRADKNADVATYSTNQNKYSSGFSRNEVYKTHGFSVRCVKVD